MMRELGGGGFTVRPLSQFTAPAPGTSSVPAGPDSSAADDPDADPRGIRQHVAVCLFITSDECCCRENEHF
jgi:hypothetical protein